MRANSFQLIKFCCPWTDPAAETKSIGLQADALVPCLLLAIWTNNKMLVERFNEATNIYNEGIIQLNIFIGYRNKQFTPKKTDLEIRQMVDVAENSFDSSRDKLKEIKNPDSNVATSILQLNRSIDEAMINLNEQKTFLDKYFSTGKIFRKSLFYKYTWMGIPIGK